jgi:hypothetical protein
VLIVPYYSKFFLLVSCYLIHVFLLIILYFLFVSWYLLITSLVDFISSLQLCVSVDCSIKCV